MKSMHAAALMSLAVTSIATAQWESGSDGSDGAFNAVISTQVDLSLAASLCDCDADTQVDDPCRWDCPSPIAGRGVYDAEQWVVVYKYTTIDVAAGATITFGMHPSGAPVVWLATGTVTITGALNLAGEGGVGPNPPVIPYYSRPGPGGFQGGQAGNPGAISATSFGLGPGSSPTNPGSGRGGSASHATATANCFGTGTGATYGSGGVDRLIGGSGGNANPTFYTTTGYGGGAGGGAVLIASTAEVTVGGLITVQGGHDGDIGGSIQGGPGSGGAIRLRAETVTLAGGSQLVARGGLISACGNYGNDGRVRVEAGTLSNLGTINGSLSFPGAPSPVFPAGPPPQLYVTAVCGQSAPTDPEWGINSADIDLNSASACTVNIEGSGMPIGTIVVVRAIPARGNIISVNSTPMIDAGGGLRTATASVTFPAGRSELQLRANW